MKCKLQHKEKKRKIYVCVDSNGSPSFVTLHEMELKMKELWAYACSQQKSISSYASKRGIVRQRVKF